MIKHCILFTATLLVTMQVSSQQVFRLVTAQREIQYLKSTPGGATKSIRSVIVEIEYWTDKEPASADKKIQLEISSAAAASSSSPVINMVPAIIPKDSFGVKHKTIVYTVPVTINAMPAFVPEFFTIGLKDDTNKPVDASAGGVIGVAIKESRPDDPVYDNPKEFSFINAVNFDFDGTAGASYVGNLNIFQPATSDCRLFGKRKFGMNFGIMKINFSKNDSLNKSYNYFENALVHPLDSIKAGTKYLRQYNNLTTVSKNITWSFYFQPMISILYSDKLKLFFHIHTELYVDKWTTNTTITNYQQDTGLITTANLSILKDSIGLLNKFSKSTGDIVRSTSTSTTLNFTLGVGLTLNVELWSGGSLFVQPTIGWAFDYARPYSINNKDLSYNATSSSNIRAHLTRFRLDQKITSNIQAVVGIDVRGKFGNDPIYAAFIGANIGLNGIKALLK